MKQHVFLEIQGFQQNGYVSNIPWLLYRREKPQRKHKKWRQTLSCGGLGVTIDPSCPSWRKYIWCADVQLKNTHIPNPLVIPTRTWLAKTIKNHGFWQFWGRFFEADEAKKRILDLSAKAEKLEVPRGSQGNVCKKPCKNVANHIFMNFPLLPCGNLIQIHIYYNSFGKRMTLADWVRWFRYKVPIPEWWCSIANCNKLPEVRRIHDYCKGKPCICWKLLSHVYLCHTQMFHGTCPPWLVPSGNRASWKISTVFPFKPP